MRLLLDTHALLWWLDGDPKLSGNAKSAIEDEANEILVSAASAWEIATKVRIGKLPDAVYVAEPVGGCLLACRHAPGPRRVGRCRGPGAPGRSARRTRV
jgi:PIN domain nuclease of toxin-antitoxin system